MIPALITPPSRPLRFVTPALSRLARRPILYVVLSLVVSLGMTFAFQHRSDERSEEISKEETIYYSSGQVARYSVERSIFKASTQEDLAALRKKHR